MASAIFRNKVVIHGLPPDMTEDRLRALLPVGVEWLRFEPGAPYAHAQVARTEDIHTLHTALSASYSVSLAPCQKVPRRRKEDSKAGSIAEDKDYTAFIASLGRPMERLISAEKQLEQAEAEARRVAEAHGGTVPAATTAILEELNSRTREPKEKRKRRTHKKRAKT